MAERVFLHVGTPKSGTTFLQSVLWENRDRLATRRFLVPGDRLYDHNLAAQANRTRPGGELPRAVAMWRHFVDQVRQWPGDAVVTNEWFTLSTPAQAARAVAALAPAEVHVIVSARDLTAVVPAAWQESLKVGRALSMSDFIGSLDDGEDRWRWSSLDPAQVLRTWAAELPPDRAHVVTVPPRGSDPALLWARFSATLGLDPTGYDTTISATNESLGAEAAALLQRIAPGLRDALAAAGAHRVEPYRWLRKYLCHELLVPRAGSRIALRPDDRDAIAARSEHSRLALARAGYDIAGELADLEPDEAPRDARHPDDVSAEEMLLVAGPLVADLLVRVRAETERRPQR